MIKNQEAKQTTGKDKRHCCIGDLIHDIKITSENKGGHYTQAACQSVYTINQIEGIDDHNYGKIGQCQTHYFRKFINSHETMHALDLNATFVNDQKSRNQLANEFLYRRDNENIVF